MSRVFKGRLEIFARSLRRFILYLSKPFHLLQHHQHLLNVVRIGGFDEMVIKARFLNLADMSFIRISGEGNQFDVLQSGLFADFICGPE